MASLCIVDFGKQKIYVFDYDYGDRDGLLDYVLNVSNSFDSKSLTGFGLFVNNNIYQLRCYIFMSFEKDWDRFERWLKEYYPTMRHMPNTFTSDFHGDMRTRGYNVVTFVGDGRDYMTQSAILSYGEGCIFLWPSRPDFARVFNCQVYKDFPHVFLCHSSKDKPVVDELFEELQRHEVRAWYDKYEIELGDDVVAKIDDGLEKCPCAIVVVSRNAIAPSAKWPRAERSFLTNAQIDNRKKIVCLNIDLDHEEIPPLLQRLRYQRLSEANALQNIAATVKRYLDTTVASA